MKKFAIVHTDTERATRIRHESAETIEDMANYVQDRLDEGEPPWTHNVIFWRPNILVMTHDHDMGHESTTTIIEEYT